MTSSPSSDWMGHGGSYRRHMLPVALLFV